MARIAGFVLRHSRGFSMLELIIYLGIFSVVSGFLIGILTTVTGINQRASANSEVASQVNFVSQIVQRLVRDSSFVDLAEGVTTSTLRLRVKDVAKDPTIISLSNNVLYLQEGASAASPITSAKVLVESAAFQKVVSPDGHDTVSMVVAITYNSTNLRARVTRTLTSAIARVSAATFDSDVVPGGSYNFNLGQGGAPWKKAILADGDANNPSYTFGSDQGVGLYKVSGLGSLGVSIPGAPGGEAMRFDTTGNVGIGTAAPGALLHLSATANAALRLTDSGGGEWELSPYSTDNDGNGVLRRVSGSGNLFLAPTGGNLGFGTSTAAAKFTFGEGAFLVAGTTGATPVAGAGTRMMWVPAKAAFRVGIVNGTEWDNANIGTNSMAFGNRVSAQATDSFALGHGVGSGLINTTADSLMIGFNSDVPTLFVGASSGSGTTGNVGIGGSIANAKLQVSGGDVYTSTAARGLILKSPDGVTCARVTILNTTGAVTSTVMACP